MFVGPLLLLFTIGGILITENIKNYSQKNENHLYYHQPDKQFTSEDEEKDFTFNWEDQFLRTLERYPELTETSSTTETSSNTDDDYTHSTLPGMTDDPSERVNSVEQKCPEGMSYDEHIIGIPFCYVLTEKQTYPPTCPYENYLEYDTMTSIYKEFENQSIWVRAERNMEDGFGQFQWVEPSTRYLDIITKYENPVGTITDKTCMIRISNRLIPVLCNETHPVLCVYSYQRQAIDKFCSRRNEFTSCISTSLNLDNKCFCQALTEGMKPSRETFCKKFAEPIDPFQNHMLLTQLTNKSPCWFGIEHTQNGMTRWSSSNETVNYTYWKSDTNFSQQYGALDYNKPRGWILQEDGTLKCAICEIEIPYQNATIHLKYIHKTNKLEIRIQNIFDVHNYFLYNYVLACFTDSNINGMKTRIISSILDLFSITKPDYTQTLTVKNYYPSYYWCETFQRPNLTRVFSNKVLIYKDEGKHNHEYALIATVPVPKGIDPYLRNLHVNASVFIRDELTENIINIVRPMNIIKFSEIEQNMHLLLHISSKMNNLSPEEEYKQLLDILETLPEKNGSFISDIIKFARSEVCLPSTTLSGNTKLHWPETRIGTTALPQELCLLEDLSPVTRKCDGDFLHGATWLEVEGECTNVAISNRTLTLYELLHSDKTSEELSYDLCAITQDNEDILLVEVHFIAEILEKLEKLEDIDITRIANTFSHIMDFDSSVLKQAQAKLNSTDITLCILDKILAKTKLTQHEEYLSIKSGKVLIQISDLKSSNVTGVVIYNTETDMPSDIYITKPLYVNTSAEDLVDEDIVVAVWLSENHVQEILDCIKVEQDDSAIKLILSFFYNDILFNEVEEKENQGNSVVISIFVPGFNCDFKTSLSMIFKPFQNNGTLNCGHWRYGTNDMMESLYGSWKLESTPEISANDSNKAICQYSHTTHYALLMLNENNKDSINPETHIALNIITAIGCGLSLVGLAGIFVTAILFKSWRKRVRNIIMLNFSSALAAQTILLFVADNTREDTLTCRISGASLHYTVLSEFAWMLIVAILQYRKFVLVFQAPIRCLLAKCLIVGWCLPVIPVTILLTIFPKSYNPNPFGLCYPQDKYFYLGVVLPICIITSINLFVFVKILLNVCHKKVEAYGPQDNEIKLQVLLAILLFFLLGMSWIFGLGAAFFGHVLFSYLFCLTATFQGFVMFIFFVVMNEKSRLLWLNIKKILFCTEVRKRIY